MLVQEIKKIFTFFAPIVLTVPFIAFAQPGPPDGLDPAAPPGPQQGLDPAQPPSQLQNPLNSDINSVEGLLTVLLDILVIIATPIVVIFIILAGFKYVTAQGDTTKLEEAKRALIYSIIGGVLIIGAAAIAEIIRGTIAAF